ncbi:hypothetical protein [Dietzia sp. SYD-A1]|uniref:hypothetical protein n=1 Tax=Dietzia sp. SYD-A1 TaxID=2780141 RepID=UPI00189110BC|nr:hypothetical protein [Dietzia sp. SYD-A1]
MAVIRFKVAGIQRYIFAGGSFLDPAGRSGQVEALTSRTFLEKFGDHVQVWHSAGGAAVARVDDAHARDVVAAWSRTVANVSDHLSVSVDRVDGLDDQPIRVLQHNGWAMSRARSRRVPTAAGTGAFGPVRCTETGDAAEILVHDGGGAQVPMSGQAHAAREEGRRAHARYQKRLLDGVTAPEGIRWQLPSKITDLGRSGGEMSQVGVLVADLNQMGRLLRSFGDGLSQEVDAGRCDQTGALARWQAVSAALADTQWAMSTAVCARLVELVDLDTDNQRPRLRGHGSGGPVVDLATGQSEGTQVVYLPVRPWIIAGDDLVMVCDGRLTPLVAQTLMHWLDDEPVDERDPRRVLRSELGQVPTIGIGAAVIPQGLPLTAGHRIAEWLCDSAKARCREFATAGIQSHGFDLDWSHTGPDIGAIHRFREEQARAGLYIGPMMRQRGTGHNPRLCDVSYVFDELIGGQLRADPSPARSRLKGPIRSAILAGSQRRAHAELMNAYQQSGTAWPPPGPTPTASDRQVPMWAWYRAIEGMDHAVLTPKGGAGDAA